MSKISDIRVVGTSVLVSVSDVTLNLLVAFFTGSTVMLSQALQGMSDLITGAILFFGVRSSKRAPDQRYQFGYGREVFFWVLIAGIIMFLGTGGLSLFFGIQQVVSPDPVENLPIAFIMLIFGFSTNFYAFRLSVRRLREAGSGKWWRELRHSSVVETKATLLIDGLGTTAGLLGLVALSIYGATGNAIFDGFGSIAIGICMMLGAAILVRDVRDLMVGRAVEPQVATDIIESASRVKGVEGVLDLRTMYLGSAKLLVILEVHLRDELSTNQIEEIIDVVKHTIKKEVPLVHHVQVEVETPEE